MLTSCKLNVLIEGTVVVYSHWSLIVDFLPAVGSVAKRLSR
jgi:hypothetical protein